MGLISILLGIIAFFCFTGAGAVLGNVMIEYKIYFSKMITSLETVSNVSLMVGFVGFFAFIGLLIGMNLVMHGINYNRLTKLKRTIKQR